MKLMGYGNARAAPDGNCLFNSMSILEYGTQDKHEEVRSNLYKKLSSLASRFAGRWDSSTCPREDEYHGDDDAYLVFKIVTDEGIRIDIKETLAQLKNEKIEGFENYEGNSFDES